jgi:hypothetical protein
LDPFIVCATSAGYVARAGGIASLTFFLYYLIILSKKQVFFISSMIPAI